MHFLMKWEMCQLPLQMLKALGTSKADCNNMLHEAEGAMVVESPSSGVGTFQLNKGQAKFGPLLQQNYYDILLLYYKAHEGCRISLKKKKKKDSSIRETESFWFLEILIGNISYIVVVSETWRRFSTKKCITLLLANSLISIITDAFLQSVLFFCLKKFRL